MVDGGAGKIVGSLVSWVKPLALRLTRNLRASIAVEKELRSNGYRPSRKAIRRAIGSNDVWKLAQRGDMSGLRAASAEVADQVGDPSFALEIERALERALMMTGTTGQALIVQNTSTASRLEALSESMSTSNADTVMFATRVQAFHPMRRRALEHLHESHPRESEQLVSVLAPKASRGERLSDLAASPPPWIRLPEVAGLAARIAEDSGDRASAHAFYELAIALGASPQVVWRVRAISVADLDAEQMEAQLRSLSEHPLVTAMLPGEPSERIQALSQWSPSDEQDKAWRLTLLAEMHFRNHDFSEAISLGLQGFQEFQAGGAGLIAARAKIVRSLSGERNLHPNDLSEAFALAMRVRNDWRSWGVISGAAVAVAMRARSLLHDVDGAWILSQVAPAGEATDYEAAYPEVQDTALQLQIDAGSIEAAEALVTERTSKSLQMQVRARRAELDDRQDEADELWNEAILAADDWGVKVGLLFRLAARGVKGIALDELGSFEPAIAGDILLIADLNAHVAGAEAAIFEATRDNSLLSEMYVRYLAKEGRPADAAEAAISAFNRWSDADFGLRAAHLFRDAGRNDRVLEILDQVIRTAPTDWGGLAATHSLIVQTAAQAGQWDKAISSAIKLVSLQPDNDRARWALISTRLHSGDEAGSVAALQEYKTDPPGRQPLLDWLALYRKFGAPVGSPVDVYRLTRPYWEDEEVRRIAVGALMFSPAPEPDDTSPDYPGNPIDDYMQDFPESTAFRPITVDLSEGPEAIVKAIQEAVAPDDVEAAERSAIARANLISSVERGALPFGALSLLPGKSFAESVVDHGAMPRFLGRPGNGSESDTVFALQSVSAVIDLTAIYSLARIPAPVAASLMNRPRHVTSSTAQLVELNLARESFRRSDHGSLNPSIAEVPSRLDIRTPFGLDTTAYVSGRMVELFQLTDRVTHSSVGDGVDEPTVDQLKNIDGVWLTGMQIARAEGAVFWCDDAITRSVAEEFGLRVFGTDSLLADLRARGEIDAQLLDTAEAKLLSDYVVGLPYRASSWHLAFDLDSRRPRGLATALRLGAPDNADEKLALVLEGVRTNVEDPAELESWAEAGAQFLVRNALPDQLTELAAQYILRLIGALSDTNDSIRFAFKGVRASQVELWPMWLREACRQLRGLVQAEADIAVASHYLLGLSRALDLADREVIVAVALEP